MHMATGRRVVLSHIASTQPRLPIPAGGMRV